MHTDFPAWMREFELGPDDGARQRRWDGVVAAAENADRSYIEPLVRLAFKTRHKPAAAVVQKIIGAFREADPEHIMDDGGRELQILAGACLVTLMDGDDADRAATAALAISAASVAGARMLNLPMNLVGMAEHQLGSLSRLNSKRPNLTEYISAEPISLTFDAAVTKLQQQPDANGMAAALKSAANATREALREVMNNQQAALEAMAKFIAQQDEELQMLWWLTGGRSWALDCPFGSVPADAQPLVFAADLAANTTVLPGPASIKGLLSRAGVRPKESTLAKVIGAADAGWLGTLVGEREPSPVTLPIHLAIKRQLEAGPGEAWVRAWAGAVEVPPDQAYSQLIVAEYFYRERLLISALNT